MKTLLLACICFCTLHETHSFAAVTADTLTGSNSIVQAIAIANSAVDAEIVKAEKKYVSERLVWRLNLQLPAGSALVLNISVNENRITDAKGDEGPFEYDFDPGQGLMRFSEAKASAEKESGAGILKWRLSESAAGFRYQFWIFAKGGPAQYKLDAKTGERIMKKKTRKKSNSD